MNDMAESKYPKKHKKKFIPKTLLNEKEIEFFNKLKVGLVGLHVFPQVSMNQVLDVEQQRDYRDRIPFWSKIIDFVVCTPKCQVIAMVELDGPSHDYPDKKVKDAERDAMLREAGYIVVRYDWRTEVSEYQLNQDFKEIILQWNRVRLEERILKTLAEVEV
ncbi:hypothetical protein C4J81_00330 [Deltaproteobacteria bacterium Smac51]|nr:hypothetical protein C4J81_00250 [Deltaproteobacteria bacterium Smac51]UQZ87745.1 hypothetical protein C4J81_00330 [Deltaproteobacteria bacterium Smac51]